MDWNERTWAYEWDAPVGRKLHARVVKSSDRLLYLFPSSCLCNCTVNKLQSTTDTNDSPVSFAHSNFRRTNTVPKERAALLNAIYLSLHTISLVQYEKKASPIIADGGDNHSRHTESEIKNCDD